MHTSFIQAVSFNAQSACTCLFTSGGSVLLGRRPSIVVYISLSLATPCFPVSMHFPEFILIFVFKRKETKQENDQVCHFSSMTVT